MSTVYLSCVAVIGVIVNFYWARVIKLVIKTKRKAGADAQLVPREPLGRALRVIWYPTVALWCIHPLVTLAARDHLPAALRPLWNVPAVSILGAVVAVIAMWATLVCWRRMGKSWRMGINPGEKTTLVVSGPWAYVAHPIYALSSVLMAASAAVVASPVMLVAAAFHLFFLQWEARREEKNLVDVHGDVYGNYIAHVGRFVPRSTKPFQS